MKVQARADQLLSQLLMETFDTLTSQYRHIRHLHEEVKCQKYYIILSRFDYLCILTSFTLLTITARGVSKKHCVLPFFINLGIEQTNKWLSFGTMSRTISIILEKNLYEYSDTAQETNSHVV